jgi:hypothetical protein
MRNCAAMGVLLIGAAVATSFLAAAATRRTSLVAALLLAYLAYVANLGVTTLVLSPIHQVTRGGLAVAEAVLLGAALLAWWLRGRPGLPLAPAQAAWREVRSDVVVVLFVAFVAALLAYELVLAVTVPPNNGDALMYHLPRAAMWAQHAGIYWVPYAPNVEINAYQPLAELQIFFLFVAAGSGALLALPQFVAELAVLVAAYGGARRLGFDVRASVCASCLLATFSVMALEATTAQNDLVTASFAATASCLLLGRGLLEPGAAGAAAAFGIGTKLTGGLAVPFLIALALVRGRRVVGAAAVGGVAGFVGLAMWGYVLNVIHTDHLLGVGTGAVQVRGSPSYPKSVAQAFYLMYGLMDLSVLSDRLIWILAAAGASIAVAVAAWSLRRAGVRHAIADAAATAIPFLAPILVVGGAAVVAFVAGAWGFPIRGRGGMLEALEANLNQTYTRISNENYSAFGPVGIVALAVAIVLTIRAFVARRVDARHLVLASVLPGFLVLLAASSTWVPWLIRFFLIPAGMAAPLLAVLFRRRLPGAAYAGVAALAIALTIVHDQTKPLSSPNGFGRPWQLTQAEAMATNSRTEVARGIAAYDDAVPAHACVGAVLDAWEPAYLLFGSQLDRRVVYLPPVATVPVANDLHLSYVVLTTGLDYNGPENFKESHWRLRSLGGFWLLAVRPGADPHCA